ncbi:MAG: hypothetical protein WDN24_09455 [Sphingomonas sp.]
MNDGGDLPDRLFAQAREVTLGAREHIEVSFEELVDLVSNPALRTRFKV